MEAPWWPPKLLPGPFGCDETKIIGGLNGPGVEEGAKDFMGTPAMEMWV
jgi:hypothetical protein